MRAGRPSLALTSLAFWPFACAVYNDDSLGLGQAGGASIDNTSGASSAGTAAKGGSSAGNTSSAQAGSASLGGTTGQVHAGSGGGGEEMPAAGGDSSADGGEASGGGSSSGGKGGSAGASAGAAGKGGGSSGNGGAPTAGTSGTGGGGGGSGGVGGGPSIPVCNDHPLSARSAWTASASHSDPGSTGLPSNLLDGKVTRWSTGKAQAGDEWLQIDFGATVTLNHVNLQQGDDTNDYPRSYSVIVSNAAKDVNGAVRGSGSGKSGVSTAILLPALASGRYLLIKQTSTSLSWWSAEEIEVSCAD